MKMKLRDSGSVGNYDLFPQPATEIALGYLTSLLHDGVPLDLFSQMKEY